MIDLTLLTSFTITEDNYQHISYSLKAMVNQIKIHPQSGKILEIYLNISLANFPV